MADDDKKNLITHMMQQGHTIRDIVKLTGMSEREVQSNVDSIAGAPDAPTSPRATRPTKNPPQTTKHTAKDSITRGFKWTPESEATVEMMWHKGSDAKTIARALGTSPTQVMAKVRKIVTRKGRGIDPKTAMDNQIDTTMVKKTQKSQYTTRARRKLSAGYVSLSDVEDAAKPKGTGGGIGGLIGDTKNYFTDMVRGRLEQQFGFLGRLAGNKMFGKGSIYGGSGVAIPAIDKHTKRVTATMDRLGSTTAKGASNLVKQLNITTTKITDALDDVLDSLKKTGVQQQTGGTAKGVNQQKASGMSGMGMGILGGIAGVAGGAALMAGMKGAQAKPQAEGTKPPEGKTDTEQSLRQESGKNAVTGKEIPKLHIKAREIKYIADEIIFQSPMVRFKTQKKTGAIASDIKPTSGAEAGGRGGPTYGGRFAGGLPRRGGPGTTTPASLGQGGSGGDVGPGGGTGTGTGGARTSPGTGGEDTGGPPTPTAPAPPTRPDLPDQAQQAPFGQEPQHKGRHGPQQRPRPSGPQSTPSRPNRPNLPDQAPQAPMPPPTPHTFHGAQTPGAGMGGPQMFAQSLRPYLSDLHPSLQKKVQEGHVDNITEEEWYGSDWSKATPKQRADAQKYFGAEPPTGPPERPQPSQQWPGQPPIPRERPGGVVSPRGSERAAGEAGGGGQQPPAIGGPTQTGQIPTPRARPGGGATPGATPSGTPAVGGRPAPLTGKLYQGLGAQRPGHIHQGWDIGMEHGSIVKAKGDGVIVRSNRQARPTGGLIAIKYDDGTFSRYMHMSDTSVVKPGQRVKGGDVIGRSGTEGGLAHVHYEEWDKDPTAHGKYSRSNPHGARNLDPGAQYGWPDWTKTDPHNRPSITAGQPGYDIGGKHYGETAIAADKIPPGTAGKVAEGMGPTAGESGGKYHSYLAEQRAAIFKQIDANPELRKQLASTLGHEGNTKEQARNTLEALVNRMAMRGHTDVQKELDSGFYGPRNEGKVYGRGGRAPNEGLMRQYDWAAGEVRKGSNRIGMRQDQGMYHVRGHKDEVHGPRAGRIDDEGYGDMGKKEAENRASRRWAEEQERKIAARDAEDAKKAAAGGGGQSADKVAGPGAPSETTTGGGAGRRRTTVSPGKLDRSGERAAGELGFAGTKPTNPFDKYNVDEMAGKKTRAPSFEGAATDHQKADENQRKIDELSKGVTSGPQKSQADDWLERRKRDVLSPWDSGQHGEVVDTPTDTGKELNELAHKPEKPPAAEDESSKSEKLGSRTMDKTGGDVPSTSKKDHAFDEDVTGLNKGQTEDDSGSGQGN